MKALSYNKNQTLLKFSCPVSHLVVILQNQKKKKTTKKHTKNSRKLNNRGRQGHTESEHIPKNKERTWKCFAVPTKTSLNIWVFKQSI